MTLTLNVAAQKASHAEDYDFAVAHNSQPRKPVKMLIFKVTFESI
jgi:hypothetical protein